MRRRLVFDFSRPPNDEVTLYRDVIDYAERTLQR